MKFNKDMSKRQKVLFIVPLLLLTYTLVFFAGAAYAVAPTAAWVLNNNLSIQWKDSVGTARDLIYGDASNQWNLCPLVASAKCMTGDTSGNIAIGNGIILTAIADSAKAGLFFLSSTSANTLKYYDASSGLHSIATLDLAQTFTGAITFNMAATSVLYLGFNGNGNSLQVASTPSLNADSAIGNLIMNIPSGKQFLVAYNGGAAIWSFSSSTFKLGGGIDLNGQTLSNGAIFTGALTFNGPTTLGAGLTATGQTITGGTTSGTNIGGTYNIGGTPTFTASPTLSSGTTLPSGGIMMFGDTLAAAIAGGVTTYCPVMGWEPGATGVTSGCSTTESNVQMVLPIKGVVKNLYITLATAPGVGTSWAVTIRNAGVDSAVTCTVSGAATSCSDTTHTATITKGNNIDVSFVPSGATSGTTIQISFEIDQSG